MKINISIASKRHKGKMAAGEEATSNSCRDVDSWQHQSCLEQKTTVLPVSLHFTNFKMILALFLF